MKTPHSKMPRAKKIAAAPPPAPVTLESIMEIVQMLANEAMKNNARIRLLNEHGKPVHVLSREIVYGFSRGMLTKFFLVNGAKHSTLHLNKNMAECEKLLGKFDFIRIHESYIVNPVHADEFDLGDNCVQLDNATTVDIGPSYKSALRHLLTAG